MYSVISIFKIPEWTVGLEYSGKLTELEAIRVFNILK